MKVYQFSKELNLETIALMDKIKKWGLPVKSHMATLESETMALIKAKLREEKGSKGAKKTTKKKTASKKTAAKKATGKKTSTKASTKATKKTSSKTTKKTATKTSAKASAKASKTKSLSKKTLTKTGAVTTTVKKVSSGGVLRTSSGVLGKKEGVAAVTSSLEGAKKPQKRIIRRKASDVKEIQEKQAEEAIALKLQEEALALEEAKKNQEEAQAKDLQQDSDKPQAPSVKKARVFGKNIIGKIDLKRVSSGSGSQEGGPRTPGLKSAQRGLRSGYVAPPPVFPVDLGGGDKSGGKDEKAALAKKKTGAGAGKEQLSPPTAFKAADFRKREMVFQPKKKKVSILPGKKTEITTPAAHKRVVKIKGSIVLSDLAQEMGLKAAELVKALMAQGVSANINSELDFDTISLIVPDFGWEAENTLVTSKEVTESVAFGDLKAPPVLRPPVVTVMGHVDHGKTTLLDSIRQARVAEGEAGGITQHIGAYQVFVEKNKPITFIDTPGHAAFTQMRARGANVTDIVILVVAADDGMMPQTEEAISHAKAAGVPIVVAVNKIDKEGANPDKIKQQLSEKELVPEDWGGDTVFHEVSALNKTGLTELLESLWLHAELLELKANPKRSASGVVIESRVEKGKGNVATLLIKEGTLKTG